jgi:hypothetical protein
LLPVDGGFNSTKIKLPDQKLKKKRNFNMKYLPNGREYLTSKNTGESEEKNCVGLNFCRLICPIAERGKRGSGILVLLSGELLVKAKLIDYLDSVKKKRFF